jgi:hypothetical protein
MARKVFQDFAHVMCQKFVDAPSNADLIALVIFGSGRLELDVAAGKHWHNRAPIDAFPYVGEMRRWLEQRMRALDIAPAELASAALTVDYSVTLSRKPPLNWLIADFDFSCTGIIDAPERRYTSTLTSHKTWGLYPSFPSGCAVAPELPGSESA